LIEAPRDLDELLALLERGAGVFDEPRFDVLSHGLQCGYLLRLEHPDDAELAAAGLVHDIADIVLPDDHAHHDRVGAALVEPLLGDRVAKLVGAHVTAKRYLVATEPAYRDGLSVRSVETLLVQGEALTPRECAELEADPDVAQIVALRRADERAKDPGARVPGLTAWRTLLDGLIGARDG
jgi:predicted HD phosphohydrolase